MITGEFLTQSPLTKGANEPPRYADFSASCKAESSTKCSLGILRGWMLWKEILLRSESRKIELFQEPRSIGFRLENRNVSLRN